MLVVLASKGIPKNRSHFFLDERKNNRHSGYVNIFIIMVNLNFAANSSIGALNLEGKSRVLEAKRGNVFEEPGWHVWCGSVCEWGGAWWLFYSRWREDLGFEAWATHSEVAVARGASPTGPFFPENKCVLPVEGGALWDRDTGHNPTIFATGETLWMAYTGTFGPYQRSLPTVGEIPKDDLWWEHRNNQRVGIAMARHPLGPWKTEDRPSIEVNPEGWDSLVVNNPSVCAKPDGGWAMIYKGVTDGPRPFGKEVLHGVAESPMPGGPYTKIEGVHPFRVKGAVFAAEDPFVWWDARAGKYRAVLKDMEGFLTEAGRTLAFYESPDALEWRPSRISPVSGAALRWDDGVVESMDRLERPQITFDGNGNAVALQVACLATGEGRRSFSLSVPLAEDFFEN
jgi:hypothetical protein